MKIASSVASGSDKRPTTIVTPSEFDFGTTLELAKAGIRGAKMTFFGEIDHGCAALSNGLSMPPTVVLLFGNPKAGTPLMCRDLGVALDLPLRLLIAERPNVGVVVSHRLAREFLPTADHLTAVKMDGILSTLVRFCTNPSSNGSAKTAASP